MFFVYILHCLKDNKRYIGYTNDLDRRLNEHFRETVNQPEIEDL